MQHRLCMAHKGVKGGPGIFRSRDMDQLHLLELVLANHAPRISPIAAGLATKAQRMRHIGLRQRILLQKLSSNQICDRNFSRGGQPVRTIPGQLEGILGKLWKLSRALHGVAVYQDRYIDLLIAVGLGMEIEHELGKRTMELGQGSLEYHKTASRKAGGCLKLHAPEALAEIDVILWGKAKGPRRAPALKLDVVRLLFARRNRLRGQVGHSQQLCLEGLSHGAVPRFHGLER